MKDSLISRRPFISAIEKNFAGNGICRLAKLRIAGCLLQYAIVPGINSGFESAVRPV
jgi:hypothetical protein